MGKIFSLFAVLFFACCNAYADDAVDTARAASRNAPLTQQRSSSERGKTEQKTSTVAERGKSTAAPQPVRSTANNASRSAVVRKVAASPSQQTARESASRQQVVSRSAVQSKIIAPTAAASRTAPISARNAATTSRAAARPVISSDAARTTARVARAAIPGAARSRAAVANKVVGTSISPTYSVCRETYFSCMDEFCANKDATLRRCACSVRMHDFDDDKKKLETAQTKLTDFNERLLAVNMDEEDVEAMVESTEGEDAYNTEDKSASQKVLDEILKKINAKTTDALQTQSLAALDLSISNVTGDMFDSVDSMLGASMTTKEGEALYRAALPICVEMANEVCEPADIKIVQSAYQMSIEQDCNTLTKNYESLKSGALSKAKEASALLDMSRLTNYQTRNSGDMVGCTKQMMEVMNTDSVCGENLGKCLDWSGKYIDPLTGSAILSENLAKLGNILTMPGGDGKWATIESNADMIRFLESKKTYIEPAMKNCEEIQTAVWENFIEYALAKIKVAQNQKLESMRQNCTPLVGQCKSETVQSIKDFDSRALSIFSIAADTTVNKMCADIQSACGALMSSLDSNSDTNSESGNESSTWASSMESIDLQRTYEAVLQNCKIVGQECVKMQCQTVESQFGLCLDSSSPQRRNVLNDILDNNYCYTEVEKCVGMVPTGDLEKIEEMREGYGDFNSKPTIIPEPEEDKEQEEPRYPNGDDTDIKTKIAKNIWGGCSHKLTYPDSKIRYEDVFNDTVLAWFKGYTNDSCFSGYCPDDQIFLWNEQGGTSCESNPFASSAYEMCSNSIDEMESGGIVKNADATNQVSINNGIYDLDSIVLVHKGGINGRMYYQESETETSYFTNCCFSGKKDSFGNCCEYANGKKDEMTLFLTGIGFNKSSTDGLCDPSRQCCFEDSQRSGTADGKYCNPLESNSSWEYIASVGKKHLFCMGSLNFEHYGTTDTNINKTCVGTFVMVDGETGIYTSRLNGGNEKYLNYIYYNNSFGDAEKDRHHRLFVYLSEDSDVCEDASKGWNELTLSGNGVYCTPHKELSNIKHRIAYCEDGFWINTEDQNQKFGCCTQSGNCKNYKTCSNENNCTTVSQNGTP
ncbi:MAG: hypothetical protein LBD94_00895 [Rickettsiales bacterium]|jgi:hypothetical protein|nr:hypothetical protein [Rickettsiales bacterium]